MNSEDIVEIRNALQIIQLSICSIEIPSIWSTEKLIAKQVKRIDELLPVK